MVLPAAGTVSVSEQLVRFIRPGLTEEYSVSVDGIRQDFVIMDRLPGSGDLYVELSVDGAHGTPAADGVRLTLDGSSRELAYGRLRVTDATGKGLDARMEVLAADRLVVRVDDTGAAYPVRIDPTFSDADWVSLNSLPGTDDYVRAILADGQGNLYVGGGFTAAGNVAANGIAKWDGHSWSALGSGLEGPGGEATCNALAFIGNDLYVGGSFTTAGGQPARSIARWDGQAWSALGSGTDWGVNALAVIRSDLYVGGNFTTAGGIPANYVAKWDGSEWSALGHGLQGSYPHCNALAVIGTNLYVGGNFTSAGGVPANHIARWDGIAWSTLGSGMAGGIAYTRVHALQVIGDDLYAGGEFTQAGGTPGNYVARWDGHGWSALGTGLTVEGRRDGVSAMTAIGTDLYVGGTFTAAGGAPARQVARWDGSAWSSIGDDIVGYSGQDIRVLSTDGTDLYVGGWFDNVSTGAAQNIAWWNGRAWSALGTGMGGHWRRVEAIQLIGTDLYVGGSFTSAGGGTINHIAKWDGNVWSGLGTGMSGGVCCDGEDATYVGALAVVGTDLYAGGLFTHAGGVPAKNIARWDGSQWHALGSGLSGIEWDGVTALAVGDDTVYAGGYFTEAGGVSANSIARWDGTSWSALGSGITGDFFVLNALAVIDANLYVAGEFSTAGGIAASNIAEWNGAAWSALGSGVDGRVDSLATMGSDLYVGGFIWGAGGQTVHGITQWDGSEWSALDSALGGEWGSTVHALVVSGSDLYVGGDFISVAGVPVNNIARWDGTSWSAVGSGVNGQVNALATDDSGHLFVGGEFFIAGDKVSPFIAQVDISGTTFAWDAIPSPQQAGVPIPVTLTARDVAGDLLSSYSDPVTLSGHAPALIATNVTLGTGAVAWGYPMHTRYHDARTQVIYPAADLGRACTVTSVAVEVVSPPGQTLEAWTLRLKHTTLSEFPASPSWEASGWTGGYQGDEPPGAAGWRTFVLSAPFEYDGANNVLVDFSFNNASYSTEGQCRATDVGAYRSITFATDSAYGDPLNWSGTSPTPVRQQTVPNLVLGASFSGVVSVAVSPDVTGPFVDGVWSCEVTVAEAYSGVILRADDGLGHDGESNSFNVETVSVPDTDDDGIADTWELGYFPSLTNVAYQTDWDGDGFWDGFEFHAGTSPVDPGDYLGITSIEANATGTEVVIRWSSKSDRLYSVHVTTNLLTGMAALVDENIEATPPVNIYTDTVDGVELHTYGVEVER